MDRRGLTARELEQLNALLGRATDTQINLTLNVAANRQRVVDLRRQEQRGIDINANRERVNNINNLVRGQLATQLAYPNQSDRFPEFMRRVESIRADTPINEYEGVLRVLIERENSIYAIEVFDFFAGIYLPLQDYEEGAFVNVNMKQWVRAMQTYTTLNVRDQTRELIQLNSVMLERLTPQTLQKAASLTARVYYNYDIREVRPIVRETFFTNFILAPILTRPIEREEVDERSMITNSMTDDNILQLWRLFFSIVKFMNKIISRNIQISDIILSNDSYRRVTLNGRDFKFIQAFPYIMSNVRVQDPEIERMDDFIIVDCLSKLKFLNGIYGIEDITFKVRLKKIWFFVEITDEGNFRRSESQYFSIDLKTSDYNPDLNQVINNFQDFWYSRFYDEIQKFIDRANGQYRANFELQPDGRVNLNSILVDQVTTVGRAIERVEVPYNSGSIIRPAYCTTSSEGLIRKMGCFSEATSIGICLYESMWTIDNYSNIQSKSRRSGLSYWTRDQRAQLILTDFKQLEEEDKVIILKGESLKFYNKYKNSYQIYFWNDISGVEQDINDYLDAIPTILIYSGHAMCCKTDKLREAIRSKANHEEEVEKTYCLRPNESPKMEECLNYYLDIETAIDPETGIFKPYLICVVGDTETQTWWGFDICEDKFIDWLKGLIDENHGKTVRHEGLKKSKVTIWTYNGMKFDLVFLVRRMVRFSGFELKGSLDNIKTLDIGNVTFRDLLKIVPCGSLKKQSEFWKTTTKKGSVDHDNITYEVIEKIARGENDVLKEEIIEYCIKDCVVLKECVEAYINWVWTNLKINPYVISAASLAMSFWRTHNHPADNGYNDKGKKMIKEDKMIYGLSKAMYDKVMWSYRGGYTQVFRKRVLPEELINETISEFDMNSSYPAVMKNEDIPYRYIQTNDFGGDMVNGLQYIPYIISTNLYGVRDLEWFPDFWCPTIPKRTQDGLKCSTKHDQIDYIWGVELKFALLTGKVKTCKLFEEIQFKAGRIFEKNTEQLYKLRQEYKDSGDLAGSQVVKILLNSTYGKLAQKKYPCKKIVDDQGLIYWADKILPDTTPEAICDDLWSIQVEDDQFKHEKQIGTCVHIASYITSCGRVNLLDGIRAASNNWVNKDKVLYCDTDSVFMLGKLPEHMISETIIGKWKEELNNIGCWLAPSKKMYYLEGFVKNEPITICKSKGLCTEFMKKEDYLTLVETESLLNKQAGDKWIRKGGYVQKIINMKSMTVNNTRSYVDNGLYSMPMYE